VQDSHVDAFILSDTRPIAGVVLAGGRSRRMRQDKAALTIGGEPLLARVVRRLRLAVPEVLVIGPPELARLVEDVTILPDDQPGLGPLAGLQTAFHARPDTSLFVVACDMPFVSAALARYMIARAHAAPSAGVVALRAAAGREPLHALYAPTCAPHVAEQLAARDLALQHLLDRVQTLEIPDTEARRYDPDGLATFNANSPTEWQHALVLAAEIDARSGEPSSSV
jgi:molybdopterin-guanine dinucleotide biosynthesis protein A